MSEQKVRILNGHLWEKQDCWTTNWSGTIGTMLCKRCLNTVKIERNRNTEPYKYSDMTDMFGKRVPIDKWHICSADKNEQCKKRKITR